MKLAVALRMLALGVFTLAPSGGHAFDSFSVETTVTEWVDDPQPAAPAREAIAIFGPFRVLSPQRIELVGSIETDTPAQFRALLRAFPSVRQIDMIDCPGTGDDAANLDLARMVRKAGIATFVPNGGSVRSGGVELFLAGAERRAEPGAEFAVHSWVDEEGLEPDDYAESDPVNQEYVAYYREMGMSADNAKAFYDLTNSVPHDEALYLKPSEIASFIPLN
ncbi:hypothetical protein [Sphingorhabdus contaminans]|uniref:Alpha/beta hydrolase n=1 Tax=Sphingorhabdus contaminans TaxID=1343899 RepID=A0A553W9H3_9SPHN|nr:hypothetical protein [Sphingorhabdus contaminans]TSB01338.1 hypothetical protein FOM92_08980 [Sphingorhabdus contaminans]